MCAATCGMDGWMEPSRPAGCPRPSSHPTPPHKHTGDINETVIRETAQLLVDSGLRDAGYVYLNL